MSTPAIRDVPGVMIGHTTDLPARTGCTVITFDALTLTAAEVRGAAPGTREIALLEPGQSAQHADAILLTGGSAFGLRAADGVMQALRNLNRGFPTRAGNVPIVPGAVIFDLANVQPEVPNPDDGATAFRTAVPLSQVETGQVGVGTGAQWGKILGAEQARDGGFALAQVEVLDGTVTAAAVVNAVGMIGATRDDDPRIALLSPDKSTTVFGENTTLMAVITDVACGHDTLIRMCVGAHDALARVVWPSHTVADGDVAFASTVNQGPDDPAKVLPLCMATELAVERAILSLS